MSSVDAIASAGAVAPSLDAMLSAQTVWRAGRAPVAAAGGEPTGHAALDALLPQGGWPRSALTELLLPADGVGELSLLLPTLARMTQAGGIVAVVAPPYLPYAPAWQAAGVDLRCLEIVDADARGAPWAFEQCLRSAACAAVLGWPLHADARMLRRLQVAADSGDCLGFAFRDRKHAANPSPAALRMEHVDGAWHVRKCRGGNAPVQPFVPLVGVTSAAIFSPGLQRNQTVPATDFGSLPCEGRGRSDALASHWLAHRVAPASCAGWPDGLGRGVFGYRSESWAPPPSLPLPSQGEGQEQKLAAGFR